MKVDGLIEEQLTLEQQLETAFKWQSRRPGERRRWESEGGTEALLQEEVRGVFEFWYFGRNYELWYFLNSLVFCYSCCSQTLVGCFLKVTAICDISFFIMWDGLISVGKDISLMFCWL